MESECRPVTDRFPDGEGGVADDDPNVGDPGGGDCLKTVEQHWLVRNREQLLRGGMRNRPQPRPGTTRQHKSLHKEQGSGSFNGRAQICRLVHSWHRCITYVVLAAAIYD